MKKSFTFRLLVAISWLGISTTTWAQAITTPRTPSPAAEVAQTIGISTVSVNYSRPSVKGRLVWGGWCPLAGMLNPSAVLIQHLGVREQMKIQ